MNRSNFKISPLQIIQLSVSISALLLVFIIWAYYSPFLTQNLSPYWQDKLIDALVLIPSIGAAVAGTLLTRQFEQGESPRKIWQAFTIGLWFWVAGEIGGTVNDALYWYTTYPDLSLVNLLWLLGYFFLGLSLYYQIRLSYGTRSQNDRFLFLGWMFLAVVAAAGLTTWAVKTGLGEDYTWIVLFITVLYPVFDLIEGGIAIWLSFLFGRGQWSRPWWGLILFALVDGIESFYWFGGYDYIVPAAQTALNFISVVAYPVSYMLMGLTLLSNYFIVRYGEESGLLAWKRKKLRN